MKRRAPLKCSLYQNIEGSISVVSHGFTVETSICLEIFYSNYISGLLSGEINSVGAHKLGRMLNEI